VKERPGADEPIVEDLGGKSGEFHLNCYFIGADYDKARDKFLAELNRPGGKWLMHPWLGPLWVRPHNWSVHESNDKGGYCVIGVDFVPGGNEAAAPIPDLSDAAAASAQDLKGKVQAAFAFAQMSATSLNSFIATVQGKLDTVRNILALAQMPLTMLSQIRNVIDGIKGDINELLALPGAYAAALGSFADLLGLGPSSSDQATATSGSGNSATTATSSVTVATTPSGIPVTALPQVVDTLLALTDIPVSIPGGVGDSPALHINLASETALFSQLVLASAVEVALADYQSADDRDAVLASVLRAMDRMLPGMDDDVFQAALDCRATLIAALMAQDLAPATQRDIVSALPATLLAHRMQVDEGTFLARNKVRHPLFVRGRVYG
jgi:prophage DNA circulation protein